jgi:ribosome recycling factor
LEKDGEISEDELRTYMDDVQELTDKYIENMDALGKEKEQNIMEI